ncbi:MAG: molybdenum cofactor guanylyltransferase [Gemmatimonadaceae bacterium]
MPCTGVILAGGGATRYGGRPKGLEAVGNIRVIDRVAAALHAVTDDLLVVANDPAAPNWVPGIRVHADVIRDAGSLGGIHAAVVHAGQPVLLVAWDMPFVPSDLLRALRSLGESEHAAVAIPESDSRRGVEPMCAYYSPACQGPIEAALERGDRRVVAFFDDVPVARLAADAVARFGDPMHIFMNINSPEDLSLAQRHAAASHDRRA